MDPMSGDAPEPVLLIIADISGYTRYMTANAKTLSHSHAIITELVKTIVRQSELPLEVAKLEGDAVFLFCRKEKDQGLSAETKRIIGAKLFTFFQIFAEKAGELGRSTTCTCNACTNIEKLRLKIIVHSGEALFHKVLNFAELAGVDVIIAHRLLKNSVAADEYLLLTEAARQEVEFPEKINLVSGTETYDDLGRIKTLVYVPDLRGKPAVAPEEPAFPERFQQAWSLYWKLWFAPFAVRAGKFRHLTGGASSLGRTGFAVLTAVLTPLFLPAGAGFVLLHALKAPAPVQHAGDGHAHKADGSCCGRR